MLSVKDQRPVLLSFQTVVWRCRLRAACRDPDARMRHVRAWLCLTSIWHTKHAAEHVPLEPAGCATDSANMDFFLQPVFCPVAIGGGAAEPL